MPENSRFWLFYIRQIFENKQIAASKDVMKDLQLVENLFFFLKKWITYQNKIKKTSILCISIKMKKFRSP